jgi:hypothetical protein
MKAASQAVIPSLTCDGRRTEEKRKNGTLLSCDISRAHIADRDNHGLQAEDEAQGD